MGARQAGHRNDPDPVVAAADSDSATQRSMQGSWASRLQGHGLTQEPLGVSELVSRQMKQTRCGSVSWDCVAMISEGCDDRWAVSRVLGNWLEGSAKLGAMPNFNHCSDGGPNAAVVV